MVVMTHYPFPPLVGSTIVAYNSMKFLSKHHAIDLICLRPSSGLSHPAEFVENQELVVQRKSSRAGLWMRYLCGMLVGTPSSVSAFKSREMQEKVKKAVERVNYDALLLFEMNAIQFCPSDCFDKLIVNIEDPQSIRLRRLKALPVWSQWQKAKFSVLVKLAANYERRLLPRMAKVLLLSESDIQDLRKQGGYTNLSHMPYGVEFRNSDEVKGYEDREKVIVFSGNMDHAPNIDGLLFFLQEIYPFVLQQHTSAKLWIVGANPDPRIIEAAAKYRNQVEITGRVDDVASYIKRATVSICPVRLKIGVQTKILEALSWGTPVVTTSAGNSGIGGVSGTHFWIEDEPRRFATRVTELLLGNNWSNLSQEGLRLARGHFSWEASVAKLEHQIDVLAASKL